MHSFWGIAYNIYRVQSPSAIMDVGNWKPHPIFFGIVILQSTFGLFGLPNSNHCLAHLLNGTRCFCLCLIPHRALKPLTFTAFLWFFIRTLFTVMVWTLHSPTKMDIPIFGFKFVSSLFPAGIWQNILADCLWP